MASPLVFVFAILKMTTSHGAARSFVLSTSKHKQLCALHSLLKFPASPGITFKHSQKTLFCLSTEFSSFKTKPALLFGTCSWDKSSACSQLMQQHWTLPNKWGFPTAQILLLFVSELCFFFFPRANLRIFPFYITSFSHLLGPLPKYCFVVYILSAPVFIFTSDFPPTFCCRLSPVLIIMLLFFRCLIPTPWPASEASPFPTPHLPSPLSPFCPLGAQDTLCLQLLHLHTMDKPSAGMLISLPPAQHHSHQQKIHTVAEGLYICVSKAWYTWIKASWWLNYFLGIY